MTVSVEPGFFREWFGVHAGREVYYAERKTREFIEKHEQLAEYVQDRAKAKAPAFVSVQPYSSRDQVFGLEKMFFEFDSPGNIAVARKEACVFYKSLVQYYSALPFMKFSGKKGYHVDVFLTNTVSFPTWRLDFVKAIYERIQTKILKGFKFETLDKAIIGDIKRLERVPYSIHQVSGETCVPVDPDGKPISVTSLQPYRDQGLNTKILEVICKEIKTEEKWKDLRAQRRRGFKPGKASGIRPCVEAALSKPLHGGAGHKMRLGIVSEYLYEGFSTDQVIDLFRSQTDFSEAKTRYFVTDAAKKGYRPFKCKTIRELGFCIKDECSIFKTRRIRD